MLAGRSWRAATGLALPNFCLSTGRALTGRGAQAAQEQKRRAHAQWRFQCAIHNLLKLHRNGGLALIPAG